MLLSLDAKIEGSPEETAAEGVAIRDGRIAAIGPAPDLRALAGAEAREIDVGGRRVIPGLIDSHAHVLRAGLMWDRALRWDGVWSLEEALALVRARADQLDRG